jgi:hypothetical protein
VSWLLWCLGAAHAGNADVGGYFRVMARPDWQGGNGRLGYWNLYGRLMNEGPYGMLELRYDLLKPERGSKEPWTSVHARIEGGSIVNADAANGSLAQFRLSQVYVKSGNVLLPDVVWQLGTLEYFFGDMGLYDMRPATLFFQTVGLSGHYQSEHLELLLGAGDSGYAIRGTRYDAVPTVGGAARVRLGGHLELGLGAEARVEPGVKGNIHAPYQTPGIEYEDWVRGEVVESYVQERGPDLLDYFPVPVERTASSAALVGHVGFGGLGPLRWNNLFVRWERLHPERSTIETYEGEDIEIWVHDFTDQRYAFVLGDELQLNLVPKRLDMALGFLTGDQRDLDNQILPSDFDRRYTSSVLRLQVYPTRTFHLLAETSLAQEWSRNGNRFREHADSLFENTAGVPDSRGLELGDTDTRHTWQGKAGIVLNPLGPGIFVRPSLRLLYGVQYSNQNNAFGNSFVDTLDQYSDFGAVEQHWHQLVALEAEVWF